MTDVSGFPALSAAFTTDLVYKTVDNVPVHLTVWSPKVTSPTLAPHFLWFHPGGLVGGNRFTWLPKWLLEDLVKAGWVVATVDYRLLPRATGFDVLADCLDAYSYVKGEMNTVLKESGAATVNPSKVSVGGGSAGGWCATTLCNSLPSSEMPQSCFLLYAKLNVSSHHYNTYQPNLRILGFISPKPEYYAYLSDPKRPWPTGYELEDIAMVRGDNETQEEKERRDQCTLSINMIQYGWTADALVGSVGLSDKIAASGDEPADAELPSESRHLFPLVNITKTFPPTLLLNGDADTAVPYLHAKLFREKCLAVNVDCQTIVCPGKDHGFEMHTRSDSKDSIYQLCRPAVDFVLKFK